MTKTSRDPAGRRCRRNGRKQLGKTSDLHTSAKQATLNQRNVLHIQYRDRHDDGRGKPEDADVAHKALTDAGEKAWIIGDIAEDKGEKSFESVNGCERGINMSEKIKVAVLVSGGGTNLQALIDKEADGQIPDAHIVKVIASREDAFALERAAEAGIETAVAKEPQQVMEELQKSGADMIVLAGYMKVLPKEIIERYRNKIINIHPSLIPKYCGKGFYGKRVHKAVLEGGEKESGATVHFVDEGVDTGEIILQEKVPVLEGDTPDELAARVLKVEHRILAEGLNQIAAKIQVEKMKSDEKGGKR